MRPTHLTRIDLAVIASIIVVLAVAITGSLETARNLAKIPLCANNLKHIGLAVYEYAQIYDGSLPNILTVNLAGRPDDEELHPYVAYRQDKYFAETGKLVAFRLACLYEAGLIDPRLFYCPAETKPYRMFQSYNNPSPWGTLPQVWNTENGTNQWVRCGYEWSAVDENPELQPFSITIDGVRLPPAPKKLCRKFGNLDPNLPYCFDFLRHRDYFSHRYDRVVGLNALYSDGHVFFQDDPNIFAHPVWDFDPSSQPSNTISAIYYQRVLLLTKQIGGTE